MTRQKYTRREIITRTSAALAAGSFGLLAACKRNGDSAEPTALESAAGKLGARLAGELLERGAGGLLADRNLGE